LNAYKTHPKFPNSKFFISLTFSLIFEIFENASNGLGSAATVSEETFYDSEGQLSQRGVTLELLVNRQFSKKITIFCLFSYLAP
jgi:hypothetical protein